MISDFMGSENLSARLIGMLKDQDELIGDSAFALSGGIDSSLLFSVLGKGKHAYCVGVKGSQDFVYAEGLCITLKANLTKIYVENSDVIECYRIVKGIDPNISFLDLGFETVLAIILSRISEETLVTGQGADEIFYGYKKFSDGREENNKSSLDKLYKITLPRENQIAEYFGKKLITPYLENRIPEYFSSMDRKVHLGDGNNKLIIREAGRISGLPESIYTRGKKAAQYGTGIRKVQERLGLR